MVAGNRHEKVQFSYSINFHVYKHIYEKVSGRRKIKLSWTKRQKLKHNANIIIRPIAKLLKEQKQTFKAADTCLPSFQAFEPLQLFSQ